MTQLLTVMFLKPPLDSVPILMALQWLRAMQSLMVMLSDGRSGVLLSVIPSSSDSSTHCETVQSLQPSRSMPSLLALLKFQTWMPRTVTR
jgi:hypothetical protein